MKMILIINGHPVKDSFSFALANAYQKGAEIGKYNVSRINITDISHVY